MTRFLISDGQARRLWAGDRIRVTSRAIERAAHYCQGALSGARHADRRRRRR